MKFSVANIVVALGLVAIGLALAAAGFYIGQTDDAPGAALLGILLLLGAVVLSVRIARRKAQRPPSLARAGPPCAVSTPFAPSAPVLQITGGAEPTCSLRTRPRRHAVQTGRAMATRNGLVGWGQGRCWGPLTLKLLIFRLTTRGLLRSRRSGRRAAAMSARSWR